MQNRLISAYEALLTTGAIVPDTAQARASALLQRLANALEQVRPRTVASALLRLRPEPVPRGLYVYGAVGRGKTMLMDLFFRNVAFKSKRRLHFDAFMQEAHAAIATARAATKGDPMPVAAKAIADQGRLLCLDEFQVNDIADAMILSRLFQSLFANGAILVATSNTAPSELYLDGINRSLFLPFVEALQQRCSVFELLSSNDYRLRKLMGRKLYFTPADAAAKTAIDEVWAVLTASARGTPRTLDVRGHKLTISCAAEGTARMTFADLCGRTLGAADYQALAATVHTLILEDVPILRAEQRNEARRLITLIDTLYDQHIRLIVSADAEPDALYPRGDGSETFRRTASRLVEMRSQDYLEVSRPLKPQTADISPA